ncbi:MAG: hypothetical protein AAFU73_19810 [Planctomycetota bacterium]
MATPTRLRDHVSALALTAPVAAAERARSIAHPWFRAQALASAARWAEESDRLRFARESLRAADEGRDDYLRAAVRAWPLRALVETEAFGEARVVLEKAIEIADTATPFSSRSEAYLQLLHAAFRLGAEERGRIVDRILALAAQDEFWRVQLNARRALVVLASEEPATALALARKLPTTQVAKAERAIERGGRGPREYFWPSR